ncbi:MAG: sigma-70 family RNA polymerase sigma factor [Verrucomicrobiota bacterium]|nr:sigma-70 family RNA polymerase sigma factor [Verrucomicrobiota bacterium]
MPLKRSKIESLTDAQLLGRLSRGQRDCLDELYKRYSGVLLSTAFRVLNNSKDAEEVLQDVFVQIWAKAGTYDVRRGKPITWAMTLTRNKAIDRLRRVQRRHRLRDDLEQELLSADRRIDRDSFDETVSREASTIVRSAVMELSDDQRRAIELAFFGGLTQNEIAQQLHQPLGTVKARIRRGMIKLRTLIEPKL